MAGQRSWLARLLGRRGEPDARPPVGRPELAEPPPLTWTVGKTVLGDFTVERRLGEGGMGVVYLVRSLASGQRLAVKRALLHDEESRREFLAELQTWIDLPEHPHLVACRFVRTIGEEVVIFAEYVDGGSLTGWIEERRLPRLEQVLDVAIQFAWGLHAAHQHGLVHQDVKPGNVLLTRAGIVKVTDFGLARLRPEAAGAGGLVDYRGRTPAFCSPEQAARQPLSLQTDVWSWGLAVLQMFTGDVTWVSGVVAAEALEAFLAMGSTEESLPSLSAPLVRVLQKCFQQDPDQRWSSMAEAADAVCAAYEQMTGASYPRRMPALAARASGAGRAMAAEAGPSGMQGPRACLVLALQAAGRDPAEAEALLAQRAASSRGQAIARLACYEESYRILQSLVAGGRDELQSMLAGVCFEKVNAHLDAEDIPGALGCLDVAIALFENLVRQQDRRDVWVNSLAKCYANKALLRARSGDVAGALSLAERGIELLEQLRDQADSLPDLAHAWAIKANLLSHLGDRRATVQSYDRALGLYERLVEQGRRQEFEPQWAKACVDKALALSQCGENTAAGPLYQQGIAVLRRLVRDEGREDLAASLARAHFSLAQQLVGNDPTHAIKQCDEALQLLEPLVQQQGRQDLADELAIAYHTKAQVLEQAGSPREAIPLFTQAVSLWDRMVHPGGRRELAGRLAQGLIDKARLLLELTEYFLAAESSGAAIEIYEPLVNRDGRGDLVEPLAAAYVLRARALGGAGNRREADLLFGLGVALYERLVQREGRPDLMDVLAQACLEKASALADGGKAREAASGFARSAALLESLVQEPGNEWAQNRLGLAYFLQARAHSDAGDARAAQPVLDRAVTYLEQLVGAHQRPQQIRLLNLARQLRAQLHQT